MKKLPTDLELVTRAQAELPHNTSAFEELISRHEQKVYAVAYRYLGDDGNAKETSQEVFLKVFQQIHKFRGEAQFSTWLYRITLNACHAQHAKKKIDGDSLDDWLDDIQLSVQPECHDEADCIQHCLEQQNENERAMISLRFNSELSIQEISEVLNIKLSATKMRLYRAIETFKSHYQEFCQ